MSAHIVDDSHIHAMLTFMHSREIHGCHRWENVQNELDEAGRTLLAANHRSYNVLYRIDQDTQVARKDAEIIADYRWKRTRILSPLEMLKAIQYYEHQACEPNDWKETDAYKLVERMKERAICVLPGWEAAPWGFSSESVALASETPPSVAEYFERKLGAKLPNPFTGGDTVDTENRASPAHPEFTIHTGCGLDCKAAIEAAAAALAYLRAEVETPDSVSAAIIGAAALLTLMRRSAPTDELIGKAVAVLELVTGAGDEGREDALLDITRIAAEIINCYVYG